METRAHYVAVGVFVLAIVSLAFGAVLWLGRVEFSQVLERYYIFFRGSVAGLGKGSSVQYNGIPVGRVIDIRVDPDNIAQIQVTVEIDTGLVVDQVGCPRASRHQHIERRLDGADPRRHAGGAGSRAEARPSLCDHQAGALRARRGQGLAARTDRRAQIRGQQSERAAQRAKPPGGRRQPGRTSAP